VLIVVRCVLTTWDSVSPRGKDADGKSLPGRSHWIMNTVLKGG
jgi:hypothetical protein